MKNTGNRAWDILAKSTFSLQTKNSTQLSVLDNILMIHPVILRIIKECFNEKDGELQVLDFGCGTGTFTEVLAKRKWLATGLDTSKAMIQIARQRDLLGATFLHGDTSKLPGQPVFDLIVSIMAFHFIEDIQATLISLNRNLKNDGVMVLAIHNEEYIERCLDRNYKFQRDTTGHRVSIKFDSVEPIPIYEFKESRLRNLIEGELGLKCQTVHRPPFNQEYIKLLPDGSPEPIEVPKFLIMSFQKKV